MNKKQKLNPKKTWKNPQITVLGSVEQLTQGGVVPGPSGPIVPS